MAVMFNYCRNCGNSLYGKSSGYVPNPGRKWFEFWKRIKCDICGGSGINSGSKRPVGPPPTQQPRVRSL